MSAEPKITARDGGVRFSVHVQPRASRTHITGIHGEDPVRLYAELCEVVEEVVDHFEAEGRALPTPKTRPMQEVA